VSLQYNPGIVTSGLVLCLDAANPKSYSPNVAPYPLDIFLWVSTNFGGCTIVRDTSVTTPAGGVPCKMSITGSDPFMATYNITAYNLAPAASGQTWIVSVWVKSSIASGHTELFIFGAGSDGTVFNLGGVGGTDFNAGQTTFTTTGWERHSFSYTFSNANVAYIQVRLDGTNTGGAGQDIWFDGLQVERAASKSAFNPRVNTNGANWTDLSSSQYTPSLVNVPTYSSANNGTILFDGTNDYVNCGTTPAIGSSLTALTAEVWMYPTRAAGTLIAENGTAHNANTFYLAQENTTQLSFEVWGGTTYDAIFSTAAYQVNTWYHFVGTWTAGVRVKMYLNGVSGGGTPTGSMQTAVANGNTNLMVGSRAGTSSYFQGNIAAFRFYNRALTDAEVVQNFNAGRGRFSL
jgi:hypothetical protein